VKIAVLGCGAIGSIIVESICSGEIRNAELTALMDIYPDKCEKILENYCPTVKANISICRDLDCMFNSKPQLVVEAASQKAVEEYIPKILSRGINTVILSVGALLDENTLQEIKQACMKSGSRVYIPTGAIAGLDAVKALSNKGIKRIVLRTYKNVYSFDKNTLEKLGFKEVTAKTKIYEGRGDVAVKLFPANVNVVAALSLAAGVIPWVEVYADPELKRNIHEIEVESNVSTIYIRVENTPHPLNPKTSYLAALSALQLLKRIVVEEPIEVGT